MELRDEGVVLRCGRAQEAPVVLLSRRFGKLEAFCRKKLFLSPGVCCEFSRRRLGGRSLIFDDLVVISVPRGLDLQRLQWLHLLLQLVDTLVPEGLPEEGLFCYLNRIMMVIQSPTISCKGAVVQCASLASLLSVLGFSGGNEFERFSDFFRALTSILVDPTDSLRVEFASMAGYKLVKFVPLVLAQVLAIISDFPRLVSCVLAVFEEQA